MNNSIYRPSPVYNEAECLYMKSLLGKIIMSDTHSVSVMAAVHVCLSSSQSQSTTKKVSKQRAEELVDEWAAAGYLITVGDSITLGPRGIAEYRDTFRTKFGDYMHSCRLCNEIALQVIVIVPFDFIWRQIYQWNELNWFIKLFIPAASVSKR